MSGWLAAAALLGLLWEYEATAPQFLITLESLEGITGTRQVLVSGVVPNDCASLPGAGADTFCTSIACPGAGQFRATVAVDGRRSQMITFRIRDAACTQIDGPDVLAGGAPGATIPPGKPCRSIVKLPEAPVVTMEVPSKVDIPLTVAVPRTEAPVIPHNPKVIAKVPHTTRPVPLADPARVPGLPRAVTDPPPGSLHS